MFDLSFYYNYRLLEVYRVGNSRFLVVILSFYRWGKWGWVAWGLLGRSRWIPGLQPACSGLRHHLCKRCVAWTLGTRQCCVVWDWIVAAGPLCATPGNHRLPCQGHALWPCTGAGPRQESVHHPQGDAPTKSCRWPGPAPGSMAPGGLFLTSSLVIIITKQWCEIHCAFK